MTQTRRDFLQLISSSAIALSSWSTLAGCGPHTGGGDALWNGFRSPPSIARPFFRWWWNGNRVTAEELIWELREMHDGGAGGVEINPIGLHDTIEATGEPINWLSDEWNALVRRVADEAANLDMYTDLIVGTGWPFGGEFLTPEETIQGITLRRIDVTGPRTLELDNLPVRDTNRRILSAQLFPVPLLSSPAFLDVTNRIDTEGKLTLPIADGDWVLYLVEWRNRFRDVLYGAPGANGPVLDHFNRASVEKYLNRMSDQLGPALGGSMGSRLRSLFCDSIELEGANWTSDLPDVFQERRGYPVWPYLPLILDPDAELDGMGADTVRRARYDFSKTLAELFEERFIVPYHEWCQDNGVESRYQAYGHPWLYTDLLDGYLIPDIPEGDQWLFNAGWVSHAEIDDIRYAIWNKYASSGAHFAGRKIASSEAMTNTRGVFEASLEYVKQATDLNFVAGINHLVLHGYNYSPADAPFPGWLRFGTYFHSSNPWWKYFREWTDYTARMSFVMQESKPTAQIGILGPTADIWSNHGLDRTPFNQSPWYLHTLWQAFSNLGYGSEYINSTILTEGTISGGQFRYGNSVLDLLVVANVETLDPDVAEALGHFAEEGGRIAIVERWPARSPGLWDVDQNDARVSKAIETVRLGENVQYFDAPAAYGQLDWASGVVKSFDVRPPVALDPPDSRLFQVHTLDGTRQIYFIANVDRERRIRTEAHFQSGGRTPWLWDLETGMRRALTDLESADNMSLDLAPLQSLLVVFEDDPVDLVETQEASPDRWSPSNSGHPIGGPWHVTLEWPNGKQEERTFPELVDLSSVPGLETFSGWATYRTYFETPRAGAGWLDLGRVHETAEVFLNGITVGAVWYGPRRVFVTSQLVDGRNDLEIRVGTLLFNYVRSLKDQPNALSFVERSQRKEPLPAGLIGPVMLE